MLSSLLLFSMACSQAIAFYQNTDVIEMDAKQFKSQVLKGDELWLVEFYGGWLGGLCLNSVAIANCLAWYMHNLTRLLYVSPSAW